MKQLTFIFLLVVSFCSAQKLYHFDHQLEYEFSTYNKGFKKSKITYLTNSNDNSYYLKIISVDSLTYNIIFSHYDKHYSKFRLSKTEFHKNKSFNLTCNAFENWKNIYKKTADKYDFFELNDSITKGKEYSVYEIRTIMKYKKRKNKKGTQLFIIDKKTSYHLPLLTHPTVYEKWLTEKKFNGIHVEKKYFDRDGNIYNKESLISVQKTDKYLSIPENCDLTN